MRLDLVNIVNKYIEDGHTFVFSGGSAYIFWEGVLFQYKCEAGLKNGVYDRDLKLVKPIDKFDFPDLLNGDWKNLSFSNLKDYSKVSPSGPAMMLCVEEKSEEVDLHLCSKGLAHILPRQFQTFCAYLVNKYLGILRKNDTTALASYRMGSDGGVIMVSKGDHRIYFMTEELSEKFRLAVAVYSAEVFTEKGEDDELYSYTQQPLALEA